MCTEGPGSRGLLVAGQDSVLNAFPTPPRGSRRNLRKGPSGLADEINFEDFLTIMSYFRPIDTTMDEERVQLCRKEKLRCGCPGAPPRCAPGRPQGGVGEGRVRLHQPWGGWSRFSHTEGGVCTSLSSEAVAWQPPCWHFSAAGGFLGTEGGVSDSKRLRPLVWTDLVQSSPFTKQLCDPEPDGGDED